MRTNNHMVIKNANRFLVSNTIKEYGPITIEDIVYRTRLSRPTVLNIIKELTSDNLVVKFGVAESSIGRHPTLFTLNSTANYAIGIDFDFPPAQLAIADLNGDMVYSRHWELNINDDISIIERSLIDNINTSIIESRIKPELIIGLGIGFPAVINIIENTAVKIDRIKGWNHVAIEDKINSETGLKVYIRNDAHLLGIVEKNLLNKNAENLLYIVHRSGIGMAVFIDNDLYEGNYGNSGYIGHTTINFNGEICECGKRGCLELYSSKRAIVEKFTSYTNKNKDVTFDDIISFSKSGNDVACHVLSEAANYLGIGISNAIKLFDISQVVLGDSVPDEDNIFFQSLKKSVEFNVSNYINQPIQISLGKLEKHSYGLGGCYFVLNKELKEPKLKLRV